MSRATNPIDRFWDRVDVTPGCWLWTGSTSAGYGHIFDGQRSVGVHRFSWELHCEPIPAGMVIDHKCRVRNCVNPDHLRVVTPRVNSLENNESPLAKNATKTHCPRGHEYTPENTKKIADGRECRRCAVSGQRALRTRKRIAAGRSPRAFRSRDGLCFHGHPMTDAYQLRDGRVYCRTCTAIRGVGRKR